ncbi:unnamed protein product [Anisakis simplex]|uniref:Anion exchange protein n=1 Tax=Anisakis simplex TaxID=6269 RepID=A0A158PMZ1_ANISI|nr:unnamed protein product [Anisakis simplex]
MEFPLVTNRIDDTHDIDAIQQALIEPEDQHQRQQKLIEGQTDASRSQCGTVSSRAYANSTDTEETNHQIKSNHQLLIELYDLDLHVNEGEWCETARWIKYEEDVEGVGHHWGQPHVAFLSFHSLLLLRRCFLKGILLLDTDANCFAEICDQIGCAMITQGIQSGYIKNALRVLQLKHLRPHHSTNLSRISTAANAIFERHSNAVKQHLTSSLSATPIFENYWRSKKGAASTVHASSRDIHSSLHLDEDIDEHEVITEGEEHDYVGNQRTNNAVEKPLLKQSRFEPEIDRNPIAIHLFKPKSWVKLLSTDRSYSDGRSSLPRKAAIIDDLESAQVFAGIVPQLDRPCFVMIRLRNAVAMPDLNTAATLVRFIFVILGPSISDVSYYEMGRSISTLIADKGIDEFLNDSVVIPPGEVDNKRLLSGDEIKKALRKRIKRKNMENELVAAQKEQFTPKNGYGQIRTKNDGSSGSKLPFFSGMVNDVSKRLPYYWSDFRDAFQFQCLTSIVFMFLASFAPAITFGGLLGKYTNEKMGTMETLLAQSICGIIWGLFAAQPLLIMSATGPVLIFEASLYKFCVGLSVDFMTVRLYAGMWLMVIALVVVALDGSRLLVYVTRFTEEIFASLISAIFIAESLHFAYQNMERIFASISHISRLILQTFVENPVEDYKYYYNTHALCDDNRSLLLMETNSTINNYSMQSLTSSDVNIPRRSCNDAEPNTALLTAIILFSTFILAYAFRRLRQSFYLGRTLRHAIGDFGVLIAIVTVTSFAHILTPHPYLARLDMPDHINFTNLYARGHGLLISAYVPPTQWWAILMALVAAMLVFILLFVETEITELLLSRRDRGLMKGNGMHWDLILVAICTLICSLFGLPWMCAATVQSLAHCGSLTVMKKAAPGERAEVDHVIEQRLTTIGVSVLVGLITLAGSYLRLPLAALFGVFLYLGVMNLSGMQLIQRIVLLFIPSKYFPDTSYTQMVGVSRMHLYTAIQVGCLIIVYTVKYFKQTALAFPFVLMLFILFRQCVLTKTFTEVELKALDGEEEPEDDEWIEKDFYDTAPMPV